MNVYTHFKTNACKVSGLSRRIGETHDICDCRRYIVSFVHTFTQRAIVRWKGRHAAVIVLRFNKIDSRLIIIV